MRRNQYWRSKLAVPVIATCVGVISLTLHGSPPDKPVSATKVTEGPQIAVKVGTRMTAGPGILRTGNLPVFDPLPAGYYKHGEGPSRISDGQVAIGASAWETPGGMCKALPEDCLIDEQCATCNVCNDYECEGGACVVTPDTGTGVTDCDDGLYCNGEELCVDEGSGPMCQPATPGDMPENTCADAGQVCDEAQDACVDPCELDADCDDENDNTRDTCDVDSGLCEHVNITITGRCCTGEYPDPMVCQAITLPDCEAKDGAFLVMNNACEFVEPSTNYNGCPKYGSGIAPQGDFIWEVGPISDLSCETLNAVGDDYQTENYPGELYMQIEFLRFAGLVMDRPLNGARWQIAFYDENGIKIVDVFWPDGTNDYSGAGIRTVDFDPPLTIPTKGYVVWSVMSNFGLDGRVKLLSTDCPPDKGTNACSTMWVNNGPVNLLGVCVGGDHDGEQCDFRNGNEDCEGVVNGTCDGDSPDVLAFEIIGTKTTSPMAACCAADTAACTRELPWVCVAQGGKPQETGSLCGLCPDATPCSSDEDCDPPESGSCELIPVCEVQACCDEMTGDCIATGNATCSGTVCDNDPTAVGCTSDLDCPPECEPEDCGHCVTVAGTSLGFGTDCDPNCCELPVSLYAGGDNCFDAPVRVINVPALGEDPITITITGDNTGATFDDFPDLCNVGIFDPDDTTKDPGWWEGFSLDACAELRIDLCCTDIEGNPLQPQWANLVRDEHDGGICCDTWLGNVGVDPPIGIGRDTSGFARGTPFCDDDNLWATWGPVPAGTYYKPIYAAPDGTSASPPGAKYQMHITVGACPIAACCVGEVCSYENEYDCDQAGGWWHIGVEDCGSQPICDLPDADGLCCTGACCRGPGDCVDHTPGGQPMDEELCLEEPGEPEYIGGVSCADDPCPVCSVETEENCHPWDSNWYFYDDRLNGPVYAIADDFQPVGNQIRQICWWGMYAIAEQFLAACNPAAIPTEDFFEIRFYADDNGMPGVEIPGSPGPVTVTAKAAMDTTEPISYLYSVVFDTPIAVTPGARYWVTVSGTGDPAGECYWWMATSYNGNGFAMTEGDPNMTLDPPRWAWVEEDRTQYVLDFAFCLDTGPGAVGFDLPPAPTGSCCECDGTCTNDVVWNDCVGGFDVDSGAVIGAIVGEWDAGEACATKEVICAGGPPPGDDCDDPIVLVGSDVTEWISTRCSTTDGAPVRVDCDNDDLNSFENDVWVEYHAIFDGNLEIDLCGDSDFDVVLEVFSDDSPTCPTTCPPPPELRVPNFFADNALCTDGECNAPNWSFRAFADAGQCYLIRIGGERDTENYPEIDPVGRVRLDIRSQETICPEALPPVEDSGCPDQGHGTKNRYVSFDATELTPPGRDSLADTYAIRVKFVSVPGFEYAEGRTAWVQEPYVVTEASGSNGPVPPPTFLAAELGCGVFYTDWSGYGVIDVVNAGIIPGGVYEVQAIHAECERAEENFSAPLTVVASHVGDVVGDCAFCPCTPPQGVVDFVDISAVVEKFKNTPCNPGQSPGVPRKARADVISSDVSQPKPDKKIDFVDISHVVDAFRNQAQPPVGPPATDPCP